MDTRNLAELYDLPALDWQVVVDRLDAGLTQAPGTGGPDRHTCWLATIAADGRPHVTGIGAIWHDGAFWFETGKTTRKGRNIARKPRCTHTLAVREFDLVVDGDAHLVTDPVTVAELAGLWAEDKIRPVAPAQRGPRRTQDAFSTLRRLPHIAGGGSRTRPGIPRVLPIPSASVPGVRERGTPL